MRCARLICVSPTGSILVKDSLVTRFTNSTCSLSTCAHFNCTAARSGNAFGLNRASTRAHTRSVTKAELGHGSVQHVSSTIDKYQHVRVRFSIMLGLGVSRLLSGVARIVRVRATGEANVQGSRLQCEIQSDDEHCSIRCVTPCAGLPLHRRLVSIHGKQSSRGWSLHPAQGTRGGCRE